MIFVLWNIVALFFGSVSCLRLIHYTNTFTDRKRSVHETEVGRERDLNCPPHLVEATANLQCDVLIRERYAPKQIPVSPREQTFSHFDSGMNLLSPNPGQSPTRRV